MALALCVPLGVWAQQDDRGYLTALLEDNLSGAGRQVVITGFEGALSSQAKIAELTIADTQGVWLTLRGVALDWNRGALLGGRLSVNALTAAEIIVARGPVPDPDALPSPEASGFALPELPVSVEIGKVAATRIMLGAPVLGSEVVATLEASGALNGGEGRAALVLERTDGGPEGRLALNASYANASRQLVLDLSATEGAGGIVSGLIGLPGTPSVALSVKGAGPIDSFSANIALQSDGIDRLAGQVTLTATATGGQSFGLDLAGDLAPLFLPQYAEFFGPDVRLVTRGARDLAGRVDLSELALETRALQLEGNLVLAPDGLPERFALTGALGLPGGAPVVLPLTGDPVRVTGGTLSLGFDAAKGSAWTGSSVLQGFDRAGLGIDLVTLAGEGLITRGAAGNAVDAAISFAALGLHPEDPALLAALGPALRGTVQAGWKEGAGRVDLPKLTLDGTGYGLSGGLQVEGLDTAWRISGKGEARVDDLSRLSGFAGRVLSGAGVVTLAGSGSPLAGDFDVTGSVAGTDLAIGQAEVDALLRGASRIDASVARGAEGTAIRRLEVRAATLTAFASGTVATAGSTLSADLDFADLSVLGPQYRGALKGKARFDGTLGRATVTLEAKGEGLAVGQAQVDGLLRGASVVSLEAGIAGEAVDLRRLEVTAATLKAAARGKLAMAGSAVTADLAFADLAVLGAGYGGALRGTARFDGTVQDAVVGLEATGQGLAIGQPEVDNLLRGASQVSLDAGVKGAEVDLRRLEVTAATLAASASGRLAEAGSDVSATLAMGDLAALGRGYRGAVELEAQFQGTPAKGSLTLNGTGRGLAVGQAQADRLLAGQSTIDLALDLADRVVQVRRARLDNPQLTAEATGALADGVRKIALSARLGNLALLLPEFPGALSVQGDAAQDAQGYALDLVARGPGQIDARVAGRVASGFGSADLTIKGAAQAALANGFVDPRSVSGPLRFDLALRGPLRLASLGGRVTLAGGRIADPGLPFSLQEVEAAADLRSGRAEVSATAGVSTGGRVRLAGTVGLLAPYAADLTTTIERVTLRDPQLYETMGNGTVTVQGPLLGGAAIGGRIVLIETNLRVPSTGFAASGVIADLRHVNEPAEVRATRVRAGAEVSQGAVREARRPFGLDLTISAPNRLYIRGRGLDAELGGTLVLRGTTAAVVPSGAFNLIRGRLDILGKRLTLTRALLQLEGDFLPYLDIAATSESDGFTSTVAISGPAGDPKVSFTSNPVLPEEEVLARLLFGRGLDTISILQAAQLAGAVATLAGRGGEGIVGRLRKGFGLDDLDLATDAAGDTTVKAGKYLSRNLYSEVQVDQKGQSQINLNLDVTKSITLRGSAASDGTTGLGVFLEKDY